MNTVTRTRRRAGQNMTAKERATAKATFLASLSITANVSESCRLAGISRSIVYQWQEVDLEFGIAFQEANKQASDVLFAEAWRRATEGDEEPIVSGGKIMMKSDGTPWTVRRKSDRLLELLLKARLPEFREKGPTVNVLLPKEYVAFDPNQDGIETR